MNRAIKRSMQRKQAEKNTVPAAIDNQKLLQHIERRRALNDGIVMGFIACMDFIKQSALEVHGIGEKRTEGLLRALESKLVEYKRKYKL